MEEKHKCPTCGQSLPAGYRGFSVGDAVKHFHGNRGKVVAVFADAVEAEFTSHTGTTYNGTFDDLWFRLHPDGLQKIA